MITFVVALLLLILAYFVYGTFVAKVFGVDADRPTPCHTMADGVDYMPMATWKVFLIQFLNIAGTGPIFGAILGILYGPAAYLWIVLGCIFGGAVHDFLGGMVSIRKGGASLPEIVGDELGGTARLCMRILSLVLMILVGTVFAQTPATLLGNMTDSWTIWGSGNPVYIWTGIIFAYYILATLLPIDKLIGRIYPVFGLALLIMAAGVFGGIILYEGGMPEITDAFSNHHPNPNSISIFPGLCITIACGAVSGFHATQSPMMARCIKNERMGQRVFYGAMIAEGLVALIWAAAAIKFAGTLDVDGDTVYEKLANAMIDPNTGKANPGIIVNKICHSWLGSIGALLAILGVVAAPLTSGDTALRCARLIAADFMKIKQNKIIKRLLLCLPIFAICIVLMFIDFNVIWRYFAWFNQTLSVFTFWSLTVWLARKEKCYWITLIPALFMTTVCTSYIIVAPEGFQLSAALGIGIGVALSALLTILFFLWKGRERKNIKITTK
ncbi:MAG: carbon starvation protein A [Bacteroidales bacterium]|nr:carbon starvation protein A [Bacteroidales bacterium]